MSNGKYFSMRINNRPNEFLSEIELKILRSQHPLDFNETEEINFENEKYLWLNKNETLKWNGDLKQYTINIDSDPMLINKKSEKKLEYIQELAIRYLKPPTPSPPPPIIIKQNPSVLVPPAPPLVIRQIPNKPITPEPIVFREAPPQPPPKVDTKVITISGKKIPPPPRKVIIEKLPPLPPKPPLIIVERWLPYTQDKRRVVYQKPQSPTLIVKDPKNVVVDWQTPEVEVERHFSFLGVVEADPNEYKKKYGENLKNLNDIPELKEYLKDVQRFVDEIPELEGDIEALKLVDLDKEGLGQYKDYIKNNENNNKKDIKTKSASNALKTNYFLKNLLKSDLSSLKTSDSVEFFVDQVFDSMNKYNNGRISYDDARNIFVKYSAKHGKKFNYNDFKNLIKISNLKHKESFDFNQLKKMFLNIQFK